MNKKAIITIADSIFMSKVRYGIQLYGKVRLFDTDPKNEDLMAIQRMQNKLARVLNGVKLSDKFKSSVLVGNLKFSLCKSA